MRPLKLFWARGTGGSDGTRNAGDWYSPLICAELSGREIVYAPPHQCDLVAVGSLLQRLNKSHRLHRLGLKRRLDIWGTGSLRPEDRLTGQHTVHSVRGTLTRDRIYPPPAQAALGDPGLLADRLVERQVGKRHTLGVVPHLADRGHAEVRDFLQRHPDATLVDVREPVEQVLQTIAACELVVSSSLHGLVFADAFGVPNQWFTASDGLHGGRHKFDDYYSAFGLALEPVRLADLDPGLVGTHYARPGIEAIKAALVASFPCS